MGKGANWTENEIKFLIECIDKGMEDKQISSEFHIKTKFENKEGFHYRTIGAINRKRRYLLKSLTDESILTKPANHNKPWSVNDDIMLTHYDSMGMSTKEIAEDLERTESAIETRLKVLERKDNESFLTSVFNKFSQSTNRIINLIFGDGKKQGGK